MRNAFARSGRKTHHENGTFDAGICLETYAIRVYNVLHTENTHKCDIDERFSLFAFAQHRPYTAHNYGAATTSGIPPGINATKWVQILG